jgi:D-sedoheptulose 7-phosphate isomerase
MDKIKKIISNNFNKIEENFNTFNNDYYKEKIILASKIIIKAIKNKKKILFCGNGGSAGDSQHFAAELIGRYLFERKPLPAIALTTNTSTLTAIANDYSYDDVFSKQVEALGNSGDVLFMISTSGKSRNILKSLKIAKKKRLKTIFLTGKNIPKFQYKPDLCINVPATRVDRIQELHLVIGHNICEIVEKCTL